MSEKSKMHEIYVLAFYFVNQADKNAFHIHTDICICPYISHRIELMGNNMGTDMEKHSLLAWTEKFGESGGWCSREEDESTTQKRNSK